MICSCKFHVCAITDGLHQDVVAINFHQDNDVLVALLGSGGELPCLVRKYCVADVLDFSVDVSNFLTLQCRCVCFLKGLVLVLVDLTCFPGLVQVTF